MKHKALNTISVSPMIIDRLNYYKESLTLDKALSEVPESQKQIFMLMPDKKL